MSRHRKPTTIAATIAQFRDQAPPRFKENAAAMKYVMQFFETGLLTGIGLVRDIEDLPEPERTAALVDLRTEHDTVVMTNFLNAIHDMVDNAESPQAREIVKGAAREIVKGTKREIVPGEGEAS